MLGMVGRRGAWLSGGSVLQSVPATMVRPGQVGLCVVAVSSVSSVALRFNQHLARCAQLDWLWTSSCASPTETRHHFCCRRPLSPAAVLCNAMPLDLA